MDLPFLPHLPIESLFDDVIRLAGGRRVDELISPAPNADNADYYFEAERTFAELKEVHADANEDETLRTQLSILYAKWVEEGKVAPLASEREFVRIDLLPEDCRWKALRVFKRKLEGPVKKAARQLKATKAAFGMPSAPGILILVNEASTFLTPQVALFLLSHILRRENSSINHVIFCTVNTIIQSPDLPGGGKFWASAFVENRKEVDGALLKRLSVYWRQTIDTRLGFRGPVIEHSGEWPSMDQLRVEKASKGERDAFFMQPGRFYKARSVPFSYYCTRVQDGLATIYLVESLQHGKLVQAQFSQRQIYANARGYEEITAAAEVQRLRKMLNRLKEL